MRFARALFFAVALASPCFGQGRDPLAAEALFREGREAFKRGDWAVACPKFEESMRLDPAAGTLFNLADCEERAGKTASAWLHWQSLADMLRSSPSDARFGVAQKHAADLAPRLPRLRIVWGAASVAGATVKRDGVELGAASLGSALPIDAGKHKIEVLAPGRSPRVFEVTTQEGAITELAISPGEPAGDEPPTREPETTEPTKPPPMLEVPRAGKEERAPRGSAMAPLGWVLTAIGGAATAGAAIAGGIALAQKATVDAEWARFARRRARAPRAPGKPRPG